MGENQPTTHPTDSSVTQWQTIITTQMHFNDMILRTRAIGSSAVLAVYGYAAVTLVENPNEYIFLFDNFIHSSAVVISFALMLLTAIAALDVAYYYRLLLGMVDIGIEFETANPGIVQHTRMLCNKVSRGSANMVIVVFYGLPLVAGVAFLRHVLLNYPPPIHS